MKRALQEINYGLTTATITKKSNIYIYGYICILHISTLDTSRIYVYTQMYARMSLFEFAACKLQAKLFERAVEQQPKQTPGRADVFKLKWQKTRVTQISSAMERLKKTEKKK